MDAYKKAGVDITAGYCLVDTLKQLTHNEQLGSFGGVFPLELGRFEEPVLVAGTDGVGTKLLVANQAGCNAQVGIDLVAMCVNDILAQGAQPLFFLDYLGIGHLEQDQAAEILSGIVDGVDQAGAILLGGETAEMPDMYEHGRYDLAGFAVGIADKKNLLTVQNTKEGDVLLGLAANGLHSNGFSLVRDILFKQNDFSLDQTLPGCTADLRHELLKPTRIYVKAVYPLVQAEMLHTIAHITGGGLIENVARILPNDLDAEFNLANWPVPPIMQDLQQLGKLSFADMTQTFNLGLGLVLVVDPSKAAEVKVELEQAGQKVYHVGQVVPGSKQVKIRGEL
ncbi:phosphoribosylformylglycinamidine cyclo-ligase [Ligilactobacillus acidipiscis]|uniref:phosphoribosylformylglycinamidine cyclo-ligase n=1 Tax=Ligilactobacillus acidipiscis TaxID=89059 RepID=UPI0023F8A1B8|nr:phosphoribosylformylglycinamidine cyclo-ligase [Ligilactobacillus acidipiscis]WEV58150.1 phosphoribosylformylglycinamidine cyclo-ligase [Ligilactobacillus acidipiscis]